MAVDKCGQVIHLPILQMGQAIGKDETKWKMCGGNFH